VIRHRLRCAVLGMVGGRWRVDRDAYTAELRTFNFEHPTSKPQMLRRNGSGSGWAARRRGTVGMGLWI
jgi:hypothetical protein